MVLTQLLKPNHAQVAFWTGHKGLEPELLCGGMRPGTQGQQGTLSTIWQDWGFKPCVSTGKPAAADQSFMAPKSLKLQRCLSRNSHNYKCLQCPRYRARHGVQESLNFLFLPSHPPPSYKLQFSTVWPVGPGPAPLCSCCLLARPAYLPPGPFPGNHTCHQLLQEACLDVCSLLGGCLCAFP